MNRSKQQISLVMIPVGETPGAVRTAAGRNSSVSISPMQRFAQKVKLP
jgi:hypothetical protein